jgi:hypothetical protein
VRLWDTAFQDAATCIASIRFAETQIPATQRIRRSIEEFREGFDASSTITIFLKQHLVTILFRVFKTGRNSGRPLIGAVAHNDLIKDWRIHFDTFASSHGCDSQGFAALLVILEKERDQFGNHSDGDACQLQHLGSNVTTHRFSEYRLTSEDIDLLDAYVSACLMFTTLAAVEADGTPVWPSSRVWDNTAAVR